MVGKAATRRLASSSALPAPGRSESVEAAVRRVSIGSAPAPRRGAQHVVRRRRQLAAVGELALEPIELVAARQRALPEQMDGLLEAGGRRQHLDRQAGEDQLAGFAVDVRQVGLGGDDAFEAG